MLWRLVEVLSVLAAIAVLVALGPNVIGVGRWKKRLLGRRDES